MITIKKRQRNKIIKQRYNYGITHLSEYCQLPLELVKIEVSDDLWMVAENFSKDKYEDDLHPYLDSVSIELMWKYGTGWAGKSE